MPEASLILGEHADEAAWRALVDKALKGAPWDRLTARTADGIAIKPLYRETDVATAGDESGFPGGAPYIRGARSGPWRIRQSYAHPDLDRTNADILADLKGGVAAIELAIGAGGMRVHTADDLDRVLADVILEAAPISLDAGADGVAAAALLEAKLKGVAAEGVAFNLDPFGVWLRRGELAADDLAHAVRFAARIRVELPNATALRIDARPVHEAGGSEAQEIAAALHCGIRHLRALTDAGMSVADSAASLRFAIAIGPDVLIECAKLRALRLCWARILEASGAPPQTRAARIHAFTSRRMMTRYDAWTNILRVTTAALAAGIGGADDITTYPFSDALGYPTPFARRVARNTQHVLLEECRLGHVADPAGGSWFVEQMTRDLAAQAWTLMQQLEREADAHAALLGAVAATRDARQRAFATRRDTITGVTDYPLLDAPMPEFEPRRGHGEYGAFAPIRWAAPFEALRDRAEALQPRPAVFFANLATLTEFGPRAQFARNLFAAGGVGAMGAEDAYASMEALTEAFRASGARVAVIAGTDACYADHAANAARALKAAEADWVLLAGKPGAHETEWRAAGVDQFIFVGDDAVAALTTLHKALSL